jgi:hypothetical protein
MKIILSTELVKVVKVGKMDFLVCPKETITYYLFHVT